MTAEPRARAATHKSMKSKSDSNNTAGAVVQERLVRCSCCGDGFAPQDTKDGYCQTCHPDADMYSDPDGKLDFGGYDGEGW